jgi:hypothetical protein
VAADVDEAGEKTIFPEVVGRARYKMRIAQSIVHARDAIRVLSLQGSGGLAESSPLQRMWRDSEVGESPRGVRSSRRVGGIRKGVVWCHADGRRIRLPGWPTSSSLLCAADGDVGRRWPSPPARCETC